MCISKPQYIYLLQEREFVNLYQPVYKIGKTMQLNSKRFSQYPKGSILLLQLICLDCNACETQLIQLFTQKYTRRRDIGNEYFEGDFTGMIADIVRIITLEHRVISEPVAAEVPFADYFIEDPVIVEEPVIVEKPVLAEIIESIDNFIDNSFLCDEIKQVNAYCGKVYNCERCKYNTHTKQCYDNHLLTDRHKIKQTSTEVRYERTCIKCNKLLLSRTNAWSHKKICVGSLQPPEQTLEQKARKLKLLINKIITEL
jgi:hypothetical protein